MGVSAAVPSSGKPPKQGVAETGQQETHAAAQPAAIVKQASSGAAQQNQGCPGTHQTKLSCDALTAAATVRQADAAEAFNSIVYVEIGVGLATAFVAFWAAKFAKDAAKAARDTVNAFTAVEDAALVVEFPSGAMIESFSDGVKQPDIYFLDLWITNIGRSTARIRGWTIGNEKFARREHTLKSGETWKPQAKIQFEAPDGNFAVAVHYSSPLHKLMVLDVAAKVRSRKLSNGATQYSGRVKTSRARIEGEAGK